LEFPQQRLLRIPQAAVYLGCSVWAVRDLLRRKEIARIKLGKKFLIDRPDLDKYIERQKPVAA
jgi:excisionase family DNA binding protein